MTEPPVLELQNITCESTPGIPLFKDINLVVNEGDIVVLQGKSGSGKTTLLKCIAHLVVHTGNVKYRGRTPQAYGLGATNIHDDNISQFPPIGIPAFRTRVLYVPQRPSLLPGTPKDFLYSITELKSHQAYSKPKVQDSTVNISFKRAEEIAIGWGVDQNLWQREWSNLSGGEAQRLALAVAIALDSAEVLLLDEPTSALDAESSLMVEQRLIDEVNSIQGELKALVWITHSEEQARRVGTRFLNFVNGGCKEEVTPPV